MEGVEGEKVNLDYLGTTTLPVGKVMYYYGSKDAHIQYPPDDITVTLNLVLSKHNTTKNRQYKFIMPETKVSCEARLAGGRIIRSDQHEILCEMLIKTQELNNTEFVRKIAHSNNNATIRASAWLALLKHDTINKEDLTILKADKDQHVMKLKQKWSINV